MVFYGYSIRYDLMDGVLVETVVVSVPHVLWVAFFNFTRSKRIVVFTTVYGNNMYK
jgi:hypothetical protein